MPRREESSFEPCPDVIGGILLYKGLKTRDLDAFALMPLQGGTRPAGEDVKSRPLTLAPVRGKAYVKPMHPYSSSLILRVRYVQPQAEALYGADGPSYATEHAAGLDLRACLAEEEVCIPAGQRLLVPTGIAIQPASAQVAGFIYSRSGLGATQGLTVAQGVGVVDSDYRGEIMVMLLNTSGKEQRLRRGERMAQLIWQPVLRAEIQTVHALDATERGAGGFGHTGSV